MKKNPALLKSMKRDGNELALYLELVDSIKKMIRKDIIDYVAINSLNNMESTNLLLNPYPEVWALALNKFLKNADEIIESGIPIFVQ